MYIHDPHHYTSDSETETEVAVSNTRLDLNRPVPLNSLQGVSGFSDINPSNLVSQNTQYSGSIP